MSVPNSFPTPLRNRGEVGVHSLISNITSSDVKYALGDYTGGASEQLWTLTAHGLVSGDVVHCLFQTAMGAVVGGEASRWYVKVLSSSTFQLYSEAALTTISTNTADGSALFLKGNVPTAIVTQLVIPNIIVDAWDFTGGTVEDMGTPAQGTHGLYEADALKLLYKSASGVTAGTLDVTYYAKAPTVTYHQIAATAGGAVIDSTADGTAVFLKIG
jgi:hypothetical protein